MAEIRAFRGWRYNKSVIKDLSKVFAPPYDVISKKDQEALHRKDPRNVIRLILGKEKRGDSPRSNKYTRSREHLCDWISSGSLVQESSPAVYVYVQNYKEGNRSSERIGFVAAMKIDEKAVLRHENTLASPKKDRMALLKEVRTNLSPIFGLFEDKKAEVQKILKETLRQPAAVDVTLEGVRHRIFVESRPAQLEKLCAAMRQKPMFIADGHHRFEVASQFKNWMRSQYPKDEKSGWNYVMTYFSDCVNNPFIIYPTHRLITAPKSMKDPLAVLRKRGEVLRVRDLGAILRKLSQSREESGGKNYSFGIFTKKDGFFIFELGKKFAASVKNNPVDRLDVAVLHKMLIEPSFGIKKIEKSDAIDFTRSAEEACEKVRKGQFDMALFLRPTSLNEMLLASKKGLKMPQKSTYFYPKLLSGLVFHKFNENCAVES